MGDVNPIPSFRIGTQLATEASRGTAPAASFWYQGGRWIDVVTDGRPTIQDQQAIIFPPGHAGKRSMNQQQPVQGRQWSAGDLDANVTADFIGALLHGAMGGLSSDTVPSTDHELIVGETLAAGGEDIVLSQQPSDGGAILGFLITDASVGGTISISGIDSEGNGASETISYSSAGSVFTRTSYSAIGASGININPNADGDDGQGSVTIYGYQYFKNTFSASDQNPTYSIERIGDPQAGEPASRSFMHVGMVVQNLTVNTPAETRDGVFSVSTTWEGDPTGTSDSKTINDASPMRIWPAWSLSVTRDEVNYHKVTNQSFTINTGNRNYRSAAGVQGPQGSFFGPREVTGSNDILVDDEGEFNRWRGASRMGLQFYWVSPWALTSDQNMALTASFTSVFAEGLDGGESDGAQVLSQSWRAVADSEDDVGHFELIGNLPPTGLGASMSLSQSA